MKSNQPPLEHSPTTEKDELGLSEALRQASLPGLEIQRVLGRGGMGVVYLARQPSLDRMVAIKVLPTPKGDDELKSVERFRNEATTMARLSHRGIVSVFDSGDTPDGQPYFVMEFIDGTNLESVIRSSGRLLVDQALAICQSVCEALEYAHTQGVIHRDIKPGNILITKKGEIKVSDFGLARREATAEHLMLTGSNVALGTPDYAAPEVLSSATVPDQRADIYAVGVMLYKMLTGDMPRGLFKLPSDKFPELDQRFDSIICKAMEPEPDDRYQSTQEITKELEEIRTGAEPSPETPTKKVAKRLGLPAWLAMGGLVIALGVYVLVSSPEADRRKVSPALNLHAPVVEINNLAVNRGNIAAQAALSCFGDTFEEGYYLAKAADGKVSGGIPGRATFEESVHTIFASFGPTGRGPFTNSTNEVILTFATPVDLVELAAYVPSHDRNGPEDADRAVTAVGFWIRDDTSYRFDPIDTVTASDSDDIGGFDRVSLSGDWRSVTAVALTFTPISTAIHEWHEARVAEVIAIENPHKVEPTSALPAEGNP